MPEKKGRILRVATKSLALNYRTVFEFTTYLPRDTGNWEAAYQRFLEIM